QFFTPVGEENLHIGASLAEPCANFSRSHFGGLVDVLLPFRLGLRDIAISRIAYVQEPAAVIVGELARVFLVQPQLARQS
ncbi:MAG: hypothetical protein ACYTEK_08335, partial [Planctomycetota bacterium]